MKTNKRGVTKLFLPSVENARVELYVTNRSSMPFIAQNRSEDGSVRAYRFGRFCIGLLGRNAEKPSTAKNRDLQNCYGEPGKPRGSMKCKRAILGTIIILVALICAGWLVIPIFLKVRQAQINQQLIVAVKALRVSEVRDCLRAGANPNLQTSVSRPISFWQYFAQLILHRHPPPSATDGTPLLTDVVTCDQVIPTKAELRQRADIALLLLHSGADINWSDLVSAADCDLWDVVKVLIQHGVDVNVEANGSNYTPLNIAAEANQTEAALWLLDHGAAPNHQTRHYRYTAAMMAALNGNETLIRALIKKKADLTLTDKYGDTALAYARLKKHGQLVELLEQAGAKK